MIAMVGCTLLAEWRLRRQGEAMALILKWRNDHFALITAESALTNHAYVLKGGGMSRGEEVEGDWREEGH